MRGILLLSVIALAACNASQAEGLPARTPAAQVQGGAVARIESVESPIKVEAQFNPAQITIDKPVPWQKHKNAEGDEPTLEFAGGRAKTLDVELLFDMFETGGDVNKTYISNLERMALIDPQLKRPPMVTFTWGNTFPVFKGVVEDLNVKYTLFLPDGTPTRATVNLKMKQASSLLNKSEARECSTDADCPKGDVCLHGSCVTR